MKTCVKNRLNEKAHTKSQILEIIENFRNIIFHDLLKGSMEKLFQNIQKWNTEQSTAPKIQAIFSNFDFIFFFKF